jgi:hypothetical protein
MIHIINLNHFWHNQILILYVNIKNYKFTIQINGLFLGEANMVENVIFFIH